MKSVKYFSLILTLVWILLPNNADGQSELYKIQIKNTSELKQFFKYNAGRSPLICGHRGGPTLNFPENCIPTFENVLQKFPAFFEIDPRITKDSVIILMHDSTLERTTNGSGKVSDFTWEQLKNFKLKDPFGNITEYNIPTLDEVLQWAKGKTILMLDKKDVPLPLILNKINKHKAEHYILISTYDPKEAIFYHQHNKNIMFEAFILNKSRIKDYEDAKIPWDNIVAYVSKSKDSSLYDSLHSKGVMCIYYTAPVLEKMPEKQDRINAYKSVINRGGDILLSDNVFEIYDAVIPHKK